MKVYICKNIDDFHRCQLYLFKKGCKWEDNSIIDESGYFNLNNLHYRGILEPTFQLYVDYKIIVGWDYKSDIYFKNCEAIYFNNREEKLKRILNEGN